MKRPSRPVVPQTEDEALRNYRQNRGWFVLRGRPVPKALQLTEKEWREEYGNGNFLRGKGRRRK